MPWSSFSMLDGPGGNNFVLVHVVYLVLIQFDQKHKHETQITFRLFQVVHISTVNSAQ